MKEDDHDHNDEATAETVPFNEDAVREYLDDAIRFWREKQTVAEANVDTFQSVRMSLFGELLD